MTYNSNSNHINNMKVSNGMKYFFFSILAVIILVAGLMFFSAPEVPKTNGPAVNNIVEEETNEPSVNNVTMVDGVQIIELKAKNGFAPRKSVAKANTPTVLRINTDGTFDCSSVVRIPGLGISKNLPLSGVTDIDLGSPKVGVMDGTCGMGMYPFEITFQ